jgi:hypothetical protein
MKGKIEITSMGMKVGFFLLPTSSAGRLGYFRVYEYTSK